MKTYTVSAVEMRDHIKIIALDQGYRIVQRYKRKDQNGKSLDMREGKAVIEQAESDFKGQDLAALKRIENLMKNTAKETEEI